MIITESNIKEYLIDNGIVHREEKIVVTKLSGGNINNLFFVVTSHGKKLVIKQALPQAQFNADVILPQDRVITEYNAMHLWKNLTKLSHIPHLIHCDQKNFLLVMKAIPSEYKLLTYSLVRGDVNPEIATKLGRLLATFHTTTYKDKHIIKNFPLSEQFKVLKIGLFHLPLLDSTDNPIIKNNVNMAIARCYQNRTALIHGDMLPKNILVKDDDFYLLDYELAHFGDPSHDLGTLLSHYLLFALINYPLKEKYYHAIKCIINEYKNVISFKEIWNKILANALGHIAPTFYGRVFGVALVEFIDNATKEAIKRIITILATRSCSRLDEVFNVIDTEA